LEKEYERRHKKKGKETLAGRKTVKNGKKKSNGVSQIVCPKEARGLLRGKDSKGAEFRKGTGEGRCQQITP